jgi:hypothetical protein
MRWILTLLLCLTAFAQSQKQSASNKQDPQKSVQKSAANQTAPETGQKKTEPTGKQVQPIESQIPTEDHKESDRAQRVKEINDTLLVIFTFFLVVVGALQWWILCRHEKWMKRNVAIARSSADAAHNIADHLARSERAWVLITRVAVTAGAIDRPEGPHQVFIQCEVRNSGRTPARVLEMRATMKLGLRSDPSQTWDKSLYKPSESAITPRWVVLPDPDLRTALNYPIPGFIGTVGQDLPTPGAGQAIFIHGIVRYWDMFEETDRFTQFCYRWDDPLPNRPEGFRPAGGDQYNQQT